MRNRIDIRNELQKQSLKYSFEKPFSFEINIIELLCQNKEQYIQFKNDCNKYLKELHKYFSNSLKELNQTNNLGNTIIYEINCYIIFKCIPIVDCLYKKFSQINSNNIGKWIILMGTILQSTQKKTLERTKTFICQQCQKQYKLVNNYQNYYKFEIPNKCTNRIEKLKSNSMYNKLNINFNRKKNQYKKQNYNQNKSLSKQQQQLNDKKYYMKCCGCTKFTLLEQNKKICIDYQQLRIQQQFQHIIAGKLPQTINILIQGILIDNFRPGDDIIVSGILDYRFRRLIKDMKIYTELILFANNIIIQNNNHINNNKYLQQQQQQQYIRQQSQYKDFPLNYYQQYNLTTTEILIIKQLEFRNSILKKFCPIIYGRQIIKLALLLSLLGGVSSSYKNTKLRGQSHILLIGQPGTGKSVLIKQIAKLSDRSFITNGIGTSSAGLSVSYYKEGNDWMIQAGALVLADNGICCIDQLNLLAKKDQKSLLQAMQQQTISSAKASVLGRLNARTTIIAACNPITSNQKYNQDLDLQTNTGLSIPLLTRFDLILILKDQQNRLEDSQKCDHILSKFKYHEYNNNNNNYDEQQQHEQQQQKQQPFLLRSFLRKCKIYQPQLRQNNLLSTYYTQQRKNIQKVTTARSLQSLFRLSEAHAKFMMRDYTNQLDYITAILLTQNRYISTIEEYYSCLDTFNNKYHLNLS